MAKRLYGLRGFETLPAEGRAGKDGVDVILDRRGLARWQG